LYQEPRVDVGGEGDGERGERRPGIVVWENST